MYIAILSRAPSVQPMHRFTPEKEFAHEPRKLQNKEMLILRRPAKCCLKANEKFCRILKRGKRRNLVKIELSAIFDIGNCPCQQFAYLC